MYRGELRRWRECVSDGFCWVFLYPDDYYASEQRREEDGRGFFFYIYTSGTPCEEQRREEDERGFFFYICPMILVRTIVEGLDNLI